jgi:acetylornithine deacetylase/succinyl-diaminopimelate desuccinylase-like protein
VLPVLAEANLSIRLAPGQSVERVAPAVERVLRAAAPAGAEVDVELWSSSPPGLVPADAPAIRLGLEAFERALGVRPLLIRSGGTLPIVPALSDRGVATVITGFDLPDGNIHSPNERLLLEHVSLGLAAARELFLGWGGLSR